MKRRDVGTVKAIGTGGPVRPRQCNADEDKVLEGSAVRGGGSSSGLNGGNQDPDGEEGKVEGNDDPEARQFDELCKEEAKKRKAGKEEGLGQGVATAALGDGAQGGGLAEGGDEARCGVSGGEEEEGRQAVRPRNQ